MVKMSGGPPHHPHSRQAPPANSAWNHLQVPNYFPGRQPQHAHMTQPTWHTPTTEPLKSLAHSHIFGLEQMLSDRQYPRHGHGPGPGVDLSLTRNGSSNQNGEMSPQSISTQLPTTPISLSVRDTNKINSLPASALDIQPSELTLKPLSPVLKSLSPGLSSSSGSGINDNSVATATPTAITTSSSSSTKKRSSKRVDSILERLNPGTLEKQPPTQSDSAASADISGGGGVGIVITDEKSGPRSGVIVQATGSSHDENSNSSSILNVPTPTPRDDEVVSPYSNEDSLDSNKSRRKRKPSKTIRVTAKEEEKIIATPPIDSGSDPVAALKAEDLVQKKEEVDECDGIPAKQRRKTSSESETIDNIAAMVQEGLKTKNEAALSEPPEKIDKAIEPISVSVIKTSTEVNSDSVSTTEKNQFVEVENKLEEMFAGIEDDNQVVNNKVLTTTTDNLDDIVAETEVASTSQDNVTSTSNEVVATSPKKSTKKAKRKQKKSVGSGSKTPVSRRNSDVNNEATPTKKKASLSSKKQTKKITSTSTSSPPIKLKKTKLESVKDVYAYDSGSNASSSRSRGPFIQIRGPRDSPLSVNVINTPTNDDEDRKSTNRTSAKKFHDDSEYRHKVRSKGLHCSTLSNQYDAQTKDTTWICAFCKRGPHATELSGPTLTQNALAPGDLFGPYIIMTNCPEFERRLDDPYDKQFKSKKIVKALDGGTLGTLKSLASSSGPGSGGKKSKRKLSLDSLSSGGGGGGGGGGAAANRRSGCGSDENIYIGITDTGNDSYEIWAHEDCIVWSSGVYLIGPKIIGLEEAVWTSCNVVCDRCHLKGANICCLKRGCLHVAHVCCARLTEWQFDEDNYKTYCPEHRVPC